jgi:hypothetical protein
MVACIGNDWGGVVSEEEPWSPKDSRRLASLIVVVVAIGGIVAFLMWLNYFIDGIGS